MSDNSSSAEGVHVYVLMNKLRDKNESVTEEEGGGMSTDGVLVQQNGNR